MLRRLSPLALFCFICLAFGSQAFASPAPSTADSEGSSNVTVAEGSAAWARASLAFPQALSAEGSVGRKRSVPLAAGLSLVLPGAGQAYNRQWIKAAAGVAIEVAMIAAYATWKSDGEDGERAYQAYAHAFWSPARYALWLEDYSEWLPATEGVDIEIPTDIDFKNPDSWSVEQRARVRQLFDEIHAVEEEVYHPETGAAFSHKLPTFGSQQYYELIGKYFQFAPGWEDYEPWVDEEGNPIDGVIDPERTGPGGEKVNVKGRFRDYARDHAAANTLLRRASRMTSFLLINHVVAAIDAAVFARLHNGRVGTSVSLIPTPDGDVVPMASLRVAF